jgi:AraC-like DNA-binding protein
MRAATSVRAFLRAPIGRYLVARRHLVWCHSAKLVGVALWGRPDEGDVVELLETLAVVHSHGVHSRFDFLTDARHVDGVDPAGFRLAADHAQKELDRLGLAGRRLAFVHGAGFSGTVLSGVFAHVLPQASSRGFSDPAAAFAWLGQPRAAAEIGPLVDGAVGAPPFTATVRNYLRTRTGECPLEEAAQALGCSSRSLQRRLDNEGTTFRKLVEDARVSAAIALLVDTDEKLGAIAARLGFSSLATFSRLFRRVTGRSPSAFREKR